MASAWGLSWGSAWGNAWGLIQAQPAQPAIVGGGFTYPLDSRRSLRHAPKSVKKVIKRLAKKQIDDIIDGENRQKIYEQQLHTELAKLDLQYQAFYAELLAQERERLIDAEIKRLFALKQMRDEEEEVLAFLMAIS